MRKIYLDWSHLQNLIDQKIENSANSFFELDCFCFSFGHLADISRGLNNEQIMKRAVVLDSIQNKLFLKDADCLQISEIVKAIESRFLDKKMVSDHYFSSPHMYDLFNLFSMNSPEDVLYIKENSTFEQYLKDVLNDKGRSLVNNMYDQSLEMAQEIAIDRKDVIGRKLQIQLEKKRSFKIREGLNYFIGNALFILHLNGLPLDKIHYKNRQFYLVIRDRSYSLTDYFMEVKNLKFYHLFNEFMFLKGNELARKDPLSKKFQSAKSDITDYAHIHALICCDIVTCDNTNFALLKTAAENLKIEINNLKRIEEVHLI